MNSCVFCAILAGREPASFVYRDDRCAAFMDLCPVNRGHVLVVPNEHVAFMGELDPAVGGHLFVVGQRIAQALRESDVRCEGINLFLADGPVAGQEVMHVHLHVIPRYRGDGFGLRFGPDYGRTSPRQELDATAAQIRAQDARASVSGVADDAVADDAPVR